MAIDLRQEREQRERQEQPGHPVTSPRPRGTVWVALALTAIVAAGAGIAVLTLQDQPAPTGGVAVSYPEGAFTAEREGGLYVVVPEPVAGFTDTSIGVREGGSYEPVALRDGEAVVSPA